MFTSHTLRIICACVASALLLLSYNPPTAQADELSQLRDKIQAFTLRLADLEKADQEQGAIKELKLTQLWLNEAQAMVAKEEEDEAARNLRRVEVSLEMISFLIDQAKADKIATDREAAAVKMEREANEAKIKLEQAQARKKLLQTETGNK